MSWSEKFGAFRQFLRQVTQLALPYFRSEEKWRARGLLGAIVVLNLAAVYMLVQINAWNRLFYDALQDKNQSEFWTQLGRFAMLAGVYILIAVYKFYLTQLLEVRWRNWLTGHTLSRWLSAQAFYRMELARFTGEAGGRLPDNPDQRIQEDLRLFTAHTVSLSMGLLNALVTLASFAGILWGLSGSFSFDGAGQRWEIPGFMLWMAVLYCLAGSVLTHVIGRPLIGLNFMQQRREADFRHHMVRVREYSESIALDRGETVEREQLGGRFALVLANTLQLLKAQKRLLWFTTGFGQAAVVFPFVVAAPRFFSGAIQLGELMQIASAFGRVQDALAWFVENYDSLAAWRATTDRLTGFEAALSERNEGSASAKRSLDAINSESPEAADLRISLPDGTPLLHTAMLRVRPGAHVLVQGPSGCGKSTLFRALAGIWPFARGRVGLPARSMFLPQRPYFPNGALRDALAYPDPPQEYSDDALRRALVDAHLPELAGRLDDTDAWNQKLSGGEQQRLSIARVLLRRPQWVFADEATSALDPGTESALYARLTALARDEGGAVVSIAHRPGLATHHPECWVFEPSDTGHTRWQLRQAPAAT